MLSVEESDGEGTYSFVCPVCASDVQKQADRKIVALAGADGPAEAVPYLEGAAGCRTSVDERRSRTRSRVSGTFQ